MLKTRSNLDHLLNIDGGPTPLYLQHCIRPSSQSSRATQVKNSKDVRSLSSGNCFQKEVKPE